jgi:hypothetical protein
MVNKTKYVLYRALLILFILFTLAGVYQQFFWKQDLQQYAEQLPELWHKSDSCDVLYFAESSNATFADTDSNKKSISELLAIHYPHLTIGALNKGAVHAGVFLPLINQIPTNSKVHTIIVTLNLRSFGADWINSELESQLMKSNVLFAKQNPFINKLFMSFGYYDNKQIHKRNAIRDNHWEHDSLRFPFEFPFKTVRTWDKTFGNGFYKNNDSSWNMEKITLACHYIKSYAFQIDTMTNPRIKDFDAIVKVANQKKLRLVFTILAENVEYADSLVGPALSYLMRNNRDLLVNRYTKLGVEVVDNLELVAGYNYMDQHWTTEHYFYEGRKQIADNLALHIKIP